MGCRNDDIKSRLDDFALDRLEPVWRQAVGQHLRECEECLAAVRVARVLAGKGTGASPSAGGTHLSEEDLSAYYADPAGLDPQRVSRIKTHLESCERCAYDLQFLQSMESDFEAAIRRVPVGESILAKALHGFQVLAMKPAFAYFLLLLAAYPAFKWMTRPGLVSEPPDMLARHLGRVDSLTAGEGLVPVLLAPPAGASSQFRIPLEHDAATYTYRWRVLEADTRQPLEIVLMADLSLPHVVDVSFPVTPLPPGKLLIEVTRLEKLDTTRQATTVIPLIVSEP